MINKVDILESYSKKIINKHDKIQFSLAYFGCMILTVIGFLAFK